MATMTDRQRKYALNTVDDIYARKLEALAAAELAEKKAVPSIASVYVTKFATDRNEQHAVVDAMFSKLDAMADGLDFSANPAISLQFGKDSDGRIDPPLLKKVREQHYAKLDAIRDKYDAKRQVLAARVEKLRRDVMLGDLPPASLALINEFDKEEV